MEQREDDGRHETRLSENIHDLNRRNAYDVFDSYKRDNLEVKRGSRPNQELKRMEQPDDDGTHDWRLPENGRNLNPRNMYGISGKARPVLVHYGRLSLPICGFCHFGNNNELARVEWSGGLSLQSRLNRPVAVCPVDSACGVRSVLLNGWLDLVFAISRQTRRSPAPTAATIGKKAQAPPPLGPQK